ncbi:hypothetical protein ECANGB1_2613 [Enterospora canceri]|uniref:Uncharacterized protein n=1 Tax=Enterospora canceri TaxID=1081671 RepID=A0A1Y1SAE5_9MICR|nr:hypothetical protein ECANGB1_2613 [Enterospora canceri]
MLSCLIQLAVATEWIVSKYDEMNEKKTNATDFINKLVISMEMIQEDINKNTIEFDRLENHIIEHYQVFNSKYYMSVPKIRRIMDQITKMSHYYNCQKLTYIESLQHNVNLFNRMSNSNKNAEMFKDETAIKYRNLYQIGLKITKELLTVVYTEGETLNVELQTMLLDYEYLCKYPAIYWSVVAKRKNVVGEKHDEIMKIFEELKRIKNGINAQRAQSKLIFNGLLRLHSYISNVSDLSY